MKKNICFLFLLSFVTINFNAQAALSSRLKHIAEGVLEGDINNPKQVTSFELRGKLYFSSDEIEAVIQCFTALKKLDLSMTYVSDETINNLCRFCPKLESLILAHCSMVRDNITMKLKRLTNLNLLGCFNLENLVVEATNLESINLRFCYRLKTILIKTSTCDLMKLFNGKNNQGVLTLLNLHYCDALENITFEIRDFDRAILETLELQQLVAAIKRSSSEDCEVSINGEIV